MIRIITLLTIVLAGLTSYAKTVEFYQPEFGTDKTPKGTSHIIITGKVKPKSPVRISKKIAIINKGKVSYAKTKKIIKKGTKLRIRADENGYFKYELYSPVGKIKVPIGVKKKKSKKYKKYLLSLKVDEKEVKVTNKKGLKESPLLIKKYGVWLGTGFNFVKYTQTSSQVNLNLETFKGPSLYAAFKYRPSSKWNFNISYSSSPGEAKESTGTLTLGSKSTYSWDIISAEGVYFHPSWKNSMWKGKGKFGAIVGVQQHTVPFIERTGASQVEHEINTNSLTMLALGGEYLFKRSKWDFEVFMRYQIPLASGNTFKHKQKFAFDGSLGVSYKLTKNWRMGGFWYGQWHNYEFTHDDKYLATQPQASEVAGEQTLFFSNVEFRVGYEF